MLFSKCTCVHTLYALRTVPVVAVHLAHGPRVTNRKEKIFLAFSSPVTEQMKLLKKHQFCSLIYFFSFFTFFSFSALFGQSKELNFC